MVAAQGFREALHAGDGVVEFVGVLVAAAVADVRHQAGDGIAEVQRDGFGNGGFHVLLDGVGSSVDGVGLGGGGEVNSELGEGQIALGLAEEVDGLDGGRSLLESAGIGETDVLDGHAHEAAGEVETVLAGFEHAGEPV